MREALEDAGAWEVPRLEEKRNLLGTIAQIAPLLGLLGTVLGFMTVFRAMQDNGLNAHVAQLSSGIWQSLICTAAGLAVAIPALVGYNQLTGQLREFAARMDDFGRELLNAIENAAMVSPSVVAPPPEEVAAPALRRSF